MPVEIKIPRRLQRKLAEDKTLLGAVFTSFAQFEDLFRFSRLPFFPTYTDHGPQHIEEVLAAVDALIPDKAFRLLGPRDMATISLAVLLHDVAMHLTADGFRSLVKAESGLHPAPGFSEKPWSDLWRDFKWEASRFTGSQNQDMFGDQSRVRPPDLDDNNWTDRQYLLVGEFLRRHHPRLAHEIALSGFPVAMGESPIRLPEDLGEIRNLAGLVARSHGFALRPSLDYLQAQYDSTVAPAQVYVVYLMALLRISDYLQIHPSRAPELRLRVYRLRSVRSIREWAKHRAVLDVSLTHEDPEAIHVLANPQNVQQFLDLEDCLDGLQAELDSSWAVLGEVYGTHSELSRLGLTKRRVRWNLDRAERLRQLPFFPWRAVFDVSRGGILRILILPLYEGKPEFGVRELVQNAVDAVRELRQLHHQDTPGEEDVDVTVLLEDAEDGSSWLTVSDRGMGMTAEIVRDYFLRVGASFRDSPAWRQAFQDEHGRSMVLRSGRFGIGALASFLVGDEIDVATRHHEVQESDGVQFAARPEDELIELRRVSRTVGTTVKLKLSPRAREGLQDQSVWDWYALSHPKVVRLHRRMGIADERLAQRHVLPNPGEALPPGWHEIRPRGYDCVHWSYLDAPALTCNGLVIVAQKEELLRAKILPNLDLARPRLSVFDPDANLPLNLQRTSLTQGETPFEIELLEDVLRDFLAFVLLNAPTRPLPEQQGSYWRLEYRGVRQRPVEVAPWFSTGEWTGPQF